MTCNSKLLEATQIPINRDWKKKVLHPLSGAPWREEGKEEVFHVLLWREHQDILLKGQRKVVQVCMYYATII